MGVDVVKIADELASRVGSLGTEERAANEKRYLKSEIQHYGVSVPLIRKTARGFARSRKDVAKPDVVMLIEELWSRDVYELRKLAVNILAARIVEFDVCDVILIERLLRKSFTWALIDDMSINVVAPMLSDIPDASQIRRKWSLDDDFWVRRTAMLSLLPSLRRETTGWDEFVGYADAMLHEEEFFIQKAIGWVLREVSKHSPELVYEWMLTRVTLASTVTTREAIKYLPDSDRERLMEIRKSANRRSKR